MKKGISNKNKKLSIILIRILLILIPTFLVLYIIGIHSGFLINRILKILLLIFLIISFIMLIFAMISYAKNKNAGRVKHKRKLTWFIRIIIILYIIGCSTFLFILYGPKYEFRDWLISTAMATMNHQYICKIFYSNEEIQDSMNRNYIVEVNEEPDTSLITGNQDTYINDYEKQILQKDSEDQLYKIIRFTVNGQDAYLAAVYDPSKVTVAYTKWLDKWGQYVSQMAEDHQAPLAINGGGFFDKNYSSNGQTPMGVTISNGKIITDNGYAASSGVIGITKDNVLVLLKGKSASQVLDLGVRDAVTMGPFLIVNGKPSFTKGNGGWGYAARTAIGQRKDGIILLLVVDSNETRSKGASMVDLTEIMQNYGAINASNLDGGTSSVMVENYKIINDPIDSTLSHKTRPIATSFIVK